MSRIESTTTGEIAHLYREAAHADHWMMTRRRALQPQLRKSIIRLVCCAGVLPASRLFRPSPSPSLRQPFVDEELGWQAGAAGGKQSAEKVNLGS